MSLHAHQALSQARRYVNEGYSHIVDIDMEKFFDRVNPDYLMNLLSMRIRGKLVLSCCTGFESRCNDKWSGTGNQ